MPFYDVNANPIPAEQLPSNQPVDPVDLPAHVGHSDPVAQELSEVTRREEILKLRIKGYSHQQIADKVGGTSQSIEAIIRFALNRIDKFSGRDLEKLRKREVRLELLRLDEFLLALLPALEGRDHRVTTARAIEICLKISERRAKLVGLDQPERQLNINVNADVEGLTTEQLEAKAREVGIQLVDLGHEPLALPAPLEATSSCPLPGESPVAESSPES